MLNIWRRSCNENEAGVYVHVKKKQKKIYSNFISFSKPLRLLYSLRIYEIVKFLSSLFTLCYFFLSFYNYLKSVPIHVIVHVCILDLSRTDTIIYLLSHLSTCRPGRCHVLKTEGTSFVVII